jgi:hypothetical protein
VQHQAACLRASSDLVLVIWMHAHPNTGSIVELATVALRCDIAAVYVALKRRFIDNASSSELFTRSMDHLLREAIVGMLNASQIRADEPHRCPCCNRLRRVLQILQENVVFDNKSRRQHCGSVRDTRTQSANQSMKQHQLINESNKRR